MLKIFPNKPFQLYSEHLLAFLFLLIAQVFFQIHCGKFFGPIGLVLLFAVYSMCFFLVHKLHKYIDINLIKIFQPFIITLLTIDLVYEKSPGSISFILCFFSFIISSLVFFNSLIVKKRCSLGQVFFSYVISFASSVIIAFVVKDLTSKYYESSYLFILFQLYYLLALISCFVIGNYELVLPFSKSIYERRYIISKLIVGGFIICKLFLFIGITANSTIFGLLYTVITTTLILSYRHKKEYFLLVNLLVIAVSFFPGNFSEIYFDPVMVALVVCLFYLKSPVLLKRSSKYGELLVSYRYRTGLKTLYHNNIVHGVEPINYQGGECKQQTLTGTYRRGALLTILNLFQSADNKIAVLGMGVGMIASLLKKGQSLTYHEIDPNMQYIAVNSGLFNYIRKSPAEVDIKIGHARKTLAKDSNTYDLIIVDAYEGRKVVSEFMTVEAFKNYFSKLSDKGIVAMHLTSGNKDNELVVASICKSLGLECVICYRSSDDQEYSESITGVDRAKKNKSSSNYKGWVRGVVDFYESFKKNPQSLARDAYIVWVAIAKNKSNLATLTKDPRWHKLRFSDKVKSPTDKDARFEFSSVLTKEIE